MTDMKCVNEICRLQNKETKEAKVKPSVTNKDIIDLLQYLYKKGVQKDVTTLSEVITRIYNQSKITDLSSHINIKKIGKWIEANIPEKFESKKIYEEYKAKVEAQFTYLHNKLSYVTKRPLMIEIAAVIIYKIENIKLFVLNWPPG